MQLLTGLILAKTDHYQGFLDERFKDLATLFSRLQDARSDRGGASLAVYFKGNKVVDIYTGKKSPQDAWSENTLSLCYSTGKGVLATLAHILVSEGFLDYDVPVAKYWLEFAENNKQNITLRHILSHQSGLYDIRNIIQDAHEMLDWTHMLRVFESAKPRFVPGEHTAYQAFTFGWILGGLLEKVTQQSLETLMQSYLVEPLKLDGAFFGVPEAELYRVARPIELTSEQDQSKAPHAKQNKNKKAQPTLTERFVSWSGQDPQDYTDAMNPKGMRNFSFYTDESLKAIIPAANGVFSANSLSKIYAMLANGGRWGEQQLIKPEIFKQLTMVQSFKRDKVMPIPMHWRLGYHRVLSMGKRSRHGLEHIGYNGSGAWCDPDRHLSFAYTHNFHAGSITGDYRLWGLTQETLRCADQILSGRKGWF